MAGPSVLGSSAGALRRARPRASPRRWPRPSGGQRGRGDRRLAGRDRVLPPTTLATTVRRCLADRRRGCAPPDRVDLRDARSGRRAPMDGGRSGATPRLLAGHPAAGRCRVRARPPRALEDCCGSGCIRPGSSRSATGRGPGNGCRCRRCGVGVGDATRTRLPPPSSRSCWARRRIARVDGGRPASWRRGRRGCLRSRVRPAPRSRCRRGRRCRHAHRTVHARLAWFRRQGSRIDACTSDTHRPCDRCLRRRSPRGNPGRRVPRTRSRTRRKHRVGLLLGGRGAAPRRSRHRALAAGARSGATTDRRPAWCNVSRSVRADNEGRDGMPSRRPTAPDHRPLPARRTRRGHECRTVRWCSTRGTSAHLSQAARERTRAGIVPVDFTRC